MGDIETLSNSSVPSISNSDADDEMELDLEDDEISTPSPVPQNSRPPSPSENETESSPFWVISAPFGRSSVIRKIENRNTLPPLLLDQDVSLNDQDEPMAPSEEVVVIEQKRPKFLNPLLHPGPFEQRSATPTRNHSCGICFKSFIYKVDLSRHFSVHLNSVEKDKLKSQFKYGCKICSKRFRTPSLLNTHSYVHSKEKHFPCDICDLRFASQGSLVNHKKAVHLNLRPFVCSECGKSYREKRDLNRHTLVHTKIRTFMCTQCPQEFSHRGCLDAHVSSAHSGKHPCPNCSKSFSHKATLDTHIETIHKNQT